MTAILASIVALVAAAPATAATLPSDFEERTLVEGLTIPSAVAFAPDGRTFVTEIDGRLNVVPPGSTTPFELLDLTGEVNSYGDRGLLGLAVDSSFDDNGYLYLLYTHELLPLTPDGDGRMNSQLLRVQVNDASEVVDQKVILGTDADAPCPAPSNSVDCIPSDGNSHSIGTVRSAPDGTLWLGSGESADWGRVDALALRAYDEQTMAGKIMHVDRAGRGLPGHPFCSADTNLDHVCTKLHAKGFRNPFRFSLRPGGGVTVGDVGWNEREEIDLVGAGGRSYGWPCYEGSLHTPGYEDLPRCSVEYATEPIPQARHLLPDYDYPHEGPPGSIFGGTVIGGPTYTGDQYPAGFRDDIFVGDYSEGSIMRLTPHASDPATMQHFASGLTSLVDLELTPAGNLAYVTMADFSDGSGAVHELVYSPGNHSPVASIAANPRSGGAPLTVQLDGSGSSDQDGDPLDYDWDFGDGSAHSSAERPEHTYGDPGSYTVRLTVSDRRGLRGSTTQTVDVGSAPEVEIDAPASYRDGEPVQLHGSATDDGPLTDADFDWQIVLQHVRHLHRLTDETGPDVSFTPLRNHDADSFYELRLTVTDEDGLSTQKSVELHPETAPVRLLSQPPGAPMEYAGRSVTSPFETVGAVGFEGSASTAQALQREGRSYAFQGWNDSPDRSRPLTVPPGGITLTAGYRDVTPSLAPPPPQLPQPDRSGPRLGFSPRSGLDPGAGRLKGSATDPAGVRLVQVALGRATRSRRCRWWLTSRRRLSHGLRSCSRPPWIRAKLAQGVDPGWEALLGGHSVPAGGYRVVFRAVDGLGNVSRKLVDGTRMRRVHVARRR